MSQRNEIEHDGLTIVDLEREYTILLLKTMNNADTHAEDHEMLLDKLIDLADTIDKLKSADMKRIFQKMEDDTNV